MSRGSSSGGFMHSIKEKLFHGEKHVDTDYEQSYARFMQLNTSLHNLKANCTQYVASIYSVFLNGNNVSVELSSMLDDAANANPYQALSTQFRQAHNKLNSEKQQRINQEITENVLKPIDAALAGFAPLHQRIAKRNELHQELEYYLNKMHGLNKERDERGSKGKMDTKDQTQKYTRNTEKLDEARRNYSAFAATLMADLNNAWASRVAIIGPALASFVEAEKHYLDLYGQMLSEVDNSRSLTTAHPSVIPTPVTAADIPMPVVQGDLINKAVVAPSPLQTSTGTTPRNIETTTPGAAAGPISGRSSFSQVGTGGQTPGSSNPFEASATPKAVTTATTPQVPAASPWVPATQQDQAVHQVLAADSLLVKQPDNTYAAVPSHGVREENSNPDQYGLAQSGVNDDKAAYAHAPGAGPVSQAPAADAQATTASIPRTDMIDPTAQLQTQAGYQTSLPAPGVQSKTYGEEESKRQLQQEHKIGEA